MLHLIPAPLHRMALPWAHRIRKRWRQWRKTPLRGVSIILTDTQKRVLLLRHSYGAAVWALPGGGLAQGEDAAEGGKREIYEELDLRLGPLMLLGVLNEVISGSPHQAYIFTAPCTDIPKPDRREVLEARFFALDNLPPNISALTHSRLDMLTTV